MKLHLCSHSSGCFAERNLGSVLLCCCPQYLTDFRERGFDQCTTFPLRNVLSVYNSVGFSCSFSFIPSSSCDPDPDFLWLSASFGICHKNFHQNMPWWNMQMHWPPEHPCSVAALINGIFLCCHEQEAVMESGFLELYGILFKKGIHCKEFHQTVTARVAPWPEFQRLFLI